MEQLKIICPKCNGKKKLPDMFERIVTIGISWFFDKLISSTIGYNNCPVCNGKGSIKI